MNKYKDRLLFMIPDNELSLTFEISNTTISILHERQMKGGLNSQENLGNGSPIKHFQEM